MSTPPTQIIFHLDHPTRWSDLSNPVFIRGWAFVAEGQSVSKVRAKIDGKEIVGSVGFHRPDVPAAFPAAPDEFCGFQIAFYAPRGGFSLELEAKSATSGWTLFWATEASGPRWRWPVALGGGVPAEILAGQLALVPEYPPKPISTPPPPNATVEGELPRVSIVIPNLNQGAWLENAITGTEALDDETIEILIQDGGSADGSIDILKKYHSRLTSWVSERDDGQADAIARGFEKTEGSPEDIMAWINADDFHLPGAVKFVQRYFAQNPDVDVVYGDRVLVDETGREVGRWYLPAHDSEVLHLYDFVPQETLFWRRSIWEQVDGLDSNFQFALDWDLLLRFQAAGARIKHLPYFLGAFRLHSAQKSSAQIGATGQVEMDRLRERSLGRKPSPDELIHSPALINYLRRSARRKLISRWLS
ncbi:MAG: hypothetical protein SynsKO_20250 [Synoicihabitans sp.]